MNGRPLTDIGLYPVPLAARLVRITPTRVRGWTFGYAGTKGAPIIRGQLDAVNGKPAVGFLNLMELRFVNYFNSLGVSLQAIRAIVDEARRFAGHPHPFATRIAFETDGERIFATAQEQSGDKVLYDLLHKNWAIYEVIKQSLFQGVGFDAKGEAERWQPNEAIPDVVVNPRRSYGQPIIEAAGIPTATLHRAFLVEHSFEEVARWHKITPEQVKEAVRFELELAAAA